MNILVGLGNPGRKYANTKHNFGYWIIDEFAQKRSLTFKAGKGDYLIAKSHDVVCIKPTSYMNNSGLAIAEYFKYYNNSLNNLLIIYDDIDLPLGRLKFKPDGGTGGHRGVESIIYHMKSEKICRLRIGISEGNINIPSEKYVLSPFKKENDNIIKTIIQTTCEGIEYYLSHDINETMNEFNNKLTKGKND